VGEIDTENERAFEPTERFRTTSSANRINNLSPSAVACSLRAAQRVSDDSFYRDAPTRVSENLVSRRRFSEVSQQAATRHTETALSMTTRLSLAIVFAGE